MDLSTTELFDLSHTAAAELLRSCDAPYLAIPQIKSFIKELSSALPQEEYEEISEGVFVSRGAIISERATILPPTVIGYGTEVRPNAFIRGSALIGNGAVIGNSTEIKNAIIFDGVQLPHYNYVGDSVLGYKVHLGAGAIISNFKLDHTGVNLRCGDERIMTGLRKFGALLGDGTEVGCNSVIFPGTVIGKGTLIYPLTPVRGFVPKNAIVYSDGSIKNKELR